MASELAIRQELNRRGISNERIGWDDRTKTVLVDNRPFLQPETIREGTSFTSPQRFEQAFSSLNQPATQPTVQQTAQQQPVFRELEGIPQGMDWRERLAFFQQNPEFQQLELQRVQDAIAFFKATNQPERLAAAQDYLGRLQTIMGIDPTETPVDRQVRTILQDLIAQVQPQPISVQDIIQSPQFQAQQALAERQAQQAIRQAQEALGAAGLGRSTLLSDRAQRIQNEANQFLQTQVLPALIQQEQARQQQQFGNLLNVLSALTGQQQLQDVRQAREFEQGIAEQQLGLQERQLGLQEQQLMLREQAQQLESALARTQSAGRVVTQEDAAILGVPVGTPTFEAEQAAIRNQLEQQRTSISAGQLELARRRFEEQLKAEEETGLTEQEQLAILSAFDNSGPSIRRLLQQRYPELLGDADIFDELPTNEITDKESIDNYYAATQELKEYSDQLKEQGQELTQAEALQFAQSQRLFLNDRDYRNLLDYVRRQEYLF